MFPISQHLQRTSTRGRHQSAAQQGDSDEASRAQRQMKELVFASLLALARAQVRVFELTRFLASSFCELLLTIQPDAAAMPRQLVAPKSRHSHHRHRQ